MSKGKIKQFCKKLKPKKTWCYFDWRPLPGLWFSWKLQKHHPAHLTEDSCQRQRKYKPPLLSHRKIIFWAFLCWCYWLLVHCKIYLWVQEVKLSSAFPRSDFLHCWASRDSIFYCLRSQRFCAQQKKVKSSIGKFEVNPNISIPFSLSIPRNKLCCTLCCSFHRL